MELTWIFARQDDRLVLKRVDRDGCPTLVIDNGEVREYRFDDLSALVVFLFGLQAETLAALRTDDPYSIVERVG